MSNSPTFLTQQGFEKLQQELDYLRNEKRREVADRLHKAVTEAGTDNLAEDAEYEAAKNEQAFVEGRILHLEALLTNVRIIADGTAGSGDTVEVGSRVTIQEEGFDPEEYKIVGAEETNPSLGLISNLSPIGQAVLHRKVGDTVTVHAPDGSYKIKILKIG